MMKFLFKTSLSFWILLIPILTPLHGRASDLQIINFAVGSGDAALVILPDGKTMMIDTGTENKFNDVVYPFFQNNGITHLDYIVESHGHGDHNGGYDSLVSKGYIDINTIEWDNQTFNYEDKFEISGVNFFIYNVKNTTLYGTDANLNSLAFRMEYNGFVYTTGGDEGTGSMDRFLDEHPGKVRAHVRKTAHHLYGPLSSDFLKATDAYLFIISNNADNMNTLGPAFDNNFLPSINWLHANNRRITDPGYAITGEEGHVYTRAADSSDWCFTYLPNLTTDLIPSALTCPPFTSSINDNESLTSITTYPNPAIDYVTIDLGSSFQEVVVQVINSIGSVLDINNYQFVSSITLDVSNYNDGLYFINVVSDSERNSFKIIKNK
ncbi:MAG: T9SS type A sorting domain-containing protein [Flavobacteriales bacterium]|nr:T9SS type A sorting domain-containing protein [Flavobacteriales bacterium]